MSPNEFSILRVLAGGDHMTVRQVAEHLRNSEEYAKYICVKMVNRGLLEECVDDSGKKPRRAYRLTPRSWGIMADIWRGMEGNLRRRVARFRRVAGIIEERADRLGEASLEVSADRLGEMASLDASDEEGGAVGQQSGSR